MMIGRYTAVQVACFLLDFLIFTILIWAGLHPVASNLGSRIISGLTAFMAHRHLTFEATSGPVHQQARRYFALWVINLPATSLMVGLFAWISGNPFLAKIASDGVSFVANYLLSRRLIFTAR
ncbi:MAG: GtrA family protein [Rhizobiaceae bacterium]|nr:GtrA family protein [Rhizobiaceae bacterium]